jgi:phosphoribosylanthranilate isomerase
MINIKIKLCGFKNKSDIDLAVSCGADFIGFIFHPDSARYITALEAQKISADIPPTVKKVAVLVDAENSKIAEIVKNLRPDFLQLHGNENVQRVAEIKNLFKIPIIKAIAINNDADLLLVKDYEKFAELFLFDNKINNSSGGTGTSFDWEIMQNLKTNKLWFLAGGLNIKNIDMAIEISGAKMIDVSSGIEEIKGVKSPKLIK